MHGQSVVPFQLGLPSKKDNNDNQRPLAGKSRLQPGLSQAPRHQPRKASMATSQTDVENALAGQTSTGINIDKTTIIWLTVVISLVSIVIIAAFVVLGRAYCTPSRRFRNRYEGDYLDDRTAFESSGAGAGASGQPSPWSASQEEKSDTTTSSSQGRHFATRPPPAVVRMGRIAEVEDGNGKHQA